MFITDKANFCYEVMPFGLKNAEATYQRLMDLVFREQIDRTIEVYVDDIVVKSNNVRQHATDLAEVFERMRTFDMRLKFENCVFGVDKGKFLGFLLTSWGIEANPDKCQALETMRSLRWNDMCETTFSAVKATLEMPSILSKPTTKETMMIYLVVSSEAVNATFVQGNPK